MHSGGGIISVETAAEFPVRLVESGPAGGAIFAADIARRYRLDAVLSFDMGGTTAKICLIEDLRAARRRRTLRGRAHLSLQQGQRHADLDPGDRDGRDRRRRRLHRRCRCRCARSGSGRESAGSEPGPPATSAAAAAPTITDADLVLGKLDPDNFAGGASRFRQRGRRQAIDDAMSACALASTRPSPPSASARWSTRTWPMPAASTPSRTARTSRDFSMITFGGAGPLHAARLCEKLGIAAFLVPPGAGVGSAIGFLRAPFGYQSVAHAPSCACRTSTPLSSTTSSASMTRKRSASSRRRTARSRAGDRTDGLHALCRARLGDPRSAARPPLRAGRRRDGATALRSRTMRASSAGHRRARTSRSSAGR